MKRTLALVLISCVAISANAGAASVEGLLSLRPEQPSTKLPLTHKHLPSDFLDDAPTWSATGWTVAMAGGRALAPLDGIALPWTADAATSQTQILAYLTGAILPLPPDTSRSLVADLVLAQVLEEMLGRIRGHSFLEDQFEAGARFAALPAPERREEMLQLATTSAQRNDALWERAALLVAGGLLAAACTPADQAWPERDADAHDALRILDAILELRPGSSPAWTLKAHAQWWLGVRGLGSSGVPGSAIESFDRALRADPDDPLPVLGLVLAYRLAADPHAAFAVLAAQGPRIDGWKKRPKSRAYRHLAALEFERREPWALTLAYRTLAKAQDELHSLEGGLSMLAVIEALTATEGVGSMIEDLPTEAITARTGLARDLTAWSKRFADRDLSARGCREGGWLAGVRPLLERLLGEATAQIALVEDLDLRDKRIEDLHWAWMDWDENTAEGPSRSLTESVYGLVSESNERRFKVRRLKTGRYETALGN